jgi:hypothetical protein
MNEATLSRNMSRYPLVVVPEWQYIWQTYQCDIVNYTKAGGATLVIGAVTCSQFAQLAGLTVNGSAIVPFGAGKFGFLPFAVGGPYEANKDGNVRKAVSDMVTALFPNPIVQVTGSPWVDVGVSELNGKMIIPLVNCGGDHKNMPIIEKIDPLGPLQISIACPAQPAAITLQPANTKCQFTYANGKATLTLPSLEIYDMLVVE